MKHWHYNEDTQLAYEHEHDGGGACHIHKGAFGYGKTRVSLMRGGVRQCRVLP